MSRSPSCPRCARTGGFEGGSRDRFLEPFFSLHAVCPSGPQPCSAPPLPVSGGWEGAVYRWRVGLVVLHEPLLCCRYSGRWGRAGRAPGWHPTRHQSPSSPLQHPSTERLRRGEDTPTAGARAPHRTEHRAQGGLHRQRETTGSFGNILEIKVRRILLT